MSKHIAFLRGINVTGRNRVPMAELRAVCESLGWSNLETYIQSGNVVFGSDEKASKLEDVLEKALNSKFALQIPVVIRNAKEIAQLLDSNPFPEASEKEPNHVLLGSDLNYAEPHFIIPISCFEIDQSTLISGILYGKNRRIAVFGPIRAPFLSH